MISTFALSLLGSWSYGGFLAEPMPAPVPVSVSVPAAERVPAPSPLEPEKMAKPKETLRPESPAPRIAPPKSPEPAPPPDPPQATLYRSTDASGQTWEHSDPVYLASFVEDRNRWLASVAAASYSNYVSPRAAWFARRRSR